MEYCNWIVVIFCCFLFSFFGQMWSLFINYSENITLKIRCLSFCFCWFSLELRNFFVLFWNCVLLVLAVITLRIGHEEVKEWSCAAGRFLLLLLWCWLLRLFVFNTDISRMAMTIIQLIAIMAIVFTIGWEFCFSTSICCDWTVMLRT